MTTQHFHKNTIRHRKNSEWLQSSGNSEKPENDTKLKILKISRNYHKPSLEQGLEQYYKVTPCNEKCNFFILLSFILLKCVTFIQYLFVGTGSPHPNLRRGGVSPPDVHNSSLQERIIRLVQFLDLLFCRRGMPKWHSYR